MKNIVIVFCVINFLFSSLLDTEAKAQNKLNKLVSIHVKKARLAALLDTLAMMNSFYFSYSDDQVKGDSLVTLSVTNQPLRMVLDTLFKGNVDYKETPGYVILRLAPNNLTMQAETDGSKEQSYYISGYVLDERTGLALANASVYEKRLLVSTMTNQKGFFKIRIKSAGIVTLTVSKEFYKDASVNFLSDVSISLKPDNATYNADLNPSKAEKNWLGRIFISSAQRMQSVNLGGYFATVPFQTSFTPGLSSHGMMSSQVVNHFSINALGGYTAGLDGVELGGLFNINKQDVRYLQLAGLFNVVGGNFSGLQLSGIGNNVLKKVEGLQVGGIYNMVSDSVKGGQVAGILNYNKKDSKGFNLAGIANITGNKAEGIQIAGILNKAKVMNGFSFGVVNIADTLNGYAVGLLNLSRNGYHQLMVYSTEIAPANLAFKTGNQKLYTVLFAGINPDRPITYFTLGFGIGHEFAFSDRYYLAAELSSQTLLANKWDKSYLINRLSTIMNFKVSPKISLFAGPSFNLYYKQSSDQLSEQQQIIKNKLGLMRIGNNQGWIGWTAGLSFF